MAGVADDPGPQHSGLFSSLARQQYSALAWVQSRVFVNSLRTRRGSVELGARIASTLVFCLIAFGPAAGLGFGAWSFVTAGHPGSVAILLWVLCFVWQVFSVLFPAIAGQNPDLTLLLRFPVAFGSWVLLYLVYGLAAPSTLIGCLWALAIGIGITVASPSAFLWVFFVLAVFVLFNLMLSRALLAWVERWIAQRRTREIITGVFLALVLAGQFLNPAFHHYGNGAPLGLRQKTFVRLTHKAIAVSSALPPGVAAQALDQHLEETGTGLIPIAWLALYSLGAAAILTLRLRSEVRGENFSEAPRRSTVVRTRSHRLLDFSGPIAAVIEKELRYLLRSGPMLYQLAVPLLMVFLFSSAARAGSFTAMRREFALPLALIWAFLGLNRLACNNLGTEGHGIQFYYLSPTPLRTVILAKNIFHFLLFLVEALLITLLVFVRFGTPSAVVGAATLAWLLFAIPAYFAAGNAISVYLPFRMNMSRMRQERGALGNGMASMFSQAAILGLGVLVFLPCAALGHPWLALPILLVLALGSSAAYLLLMARIGGMIHSRSEALMLEIAKTA